MIKIQNVFLHTIVFAIVSYLQNCGVFSDSFLNTHIQL